MLDDKVMVSICCLVYNHAPYLRKCLNGFINQKTTFAYEVLIHDDASTDESSDIIREYEERYPDLIKPIYQKENQYSKKISISYRYQYSRARGKYIALCEGDDYWIDNNKLQKQFDALEKHQDCFMSVHKVSDVYYNMCDTGLYHPNFFINPGVIESREFLQYIQYWAFQTSSYFFRNVSELQESNRPNFFKVTDVGDTPLMLLFGSKGNVYYFDEIMSCYRISVENSMTNRLRKQSVEQKILHFNKQIHMMEEFDHFTAEKYHDLCVHMILYYEFNICRIKNDYKAIVSPKYRCFFSDFGMKAKVYNYINAYLPIVYRFYLMIRGKRKHE